MKKSPTELYHDVCKTVQCPQSSGVQKGDRVIIYMGMIPQAAVAMLACARIGPFILSFLVAFLQLHLHEDLGLQVQGYPDTGLCLSWISKNTSQRYR